MSIINVSEIQKTRCLTTAEFAAIHRISERHYPVPYSCRCSEFQKGKYAAYKVNGSDGKASQPQQLEGGIVRARCSHEAHTLAVGIFEGIGWIKTSTAIREKSA